MRGRSPRVYPKWYPIPYVMNREQVGCHLRCSPRQPPSSTQWEPCFAHHHPIKSSRFTMVLSAAGRINEGHLSPLSTGQGHIQREKGGMERGRGQREREVKVNTYMCGVLWPPPSGNHNILSSQHNLPDKGERHDNFNRKKCNMAVLKLYSLQLCETAIHLKTDTVNI